MKRFICAAATGAVVTLLAFGVQAQTLKIAYIDPLSGAFANVGESGLKHFQEVRGVRGHR